MFSRQEAVSLSVISYLLLGRSVAMSSFNDLNDLNYFNDFNGLNDLNDI